MRRAALITTFANCVVVEEEDNGQEFSGDEFECLEDHGCIDPRGHLFLTSCGETKCLWCGKVAWS